MELLESMLLSLPPLPTLNWKIHCKYSMAQSILEIWLLCNTLKLVLKEVWYFNSCMAGKHKSKWIMSSSQCITRRAEEAECCCPPMYPRLAQNCAPLKQLAVGSDIITSLPPVSGCCTLYICTYTGYHLLWACH